MAKRSHTAMLAGAIERPHDEVPLDEIDIALLRELERDSRQSQRALARHVNMSAPAVAERIARFERNGIIRKYSIAVDWERLGFDVVVYMPITLESGGDIEPTLEAFRAIPELEELTVVAGRYDLLARFRRRAHRDDAGARQHDDGRLLDAHARGGQTDGRIRGVRIQTSRYAARFVSNAQKKRAHLMHLHSRNTI
jgi:Lrp/AsnC family leucine-responsive transcriptional regulator